MDMEKYVKFLEDNVLPKTVLIEKIDNEFLVRYRENLNMYTLFKFYIDDNEGRRIHFIMSSLEDHSEEDKEMFSLIFCHRGGKMYFSYLYEEYDQFEKFHIELTKRIMRIIKRSSKINNESIPDNCKIIYCITSIDKKILGEIKYLSWQTPPYPEIDSSDDAGYFWTNKETFSGMAKTSRRKNFFLFETRKDAEDVIKRLRLRDEKMVSVKEITDEI